MGGLVPGAVAEMLVGVRRDPQVGPILVIGTGGVLVELAGDRAVLIAPAARGEIEAALATLRIAALIAGYRGRPAGDRAGAVAGTVDRLLAEAPDPGALRVAREDYLRRVDGLVYGDNPDQGIVRGGDFLHPEMGFALTFPAGWEVQNSADAVVAREPGRDRYMLLQLAEDTGRGLPQIADTEMADAGFRQLQGGMTEINGLEAYLGSWAQDVRGIGPTVARIAWIRSGTLVYLFGAFVPMDEFDLVERAIHGSLRSFRTLSAAEADAIRPNRVALHTVREGENWQGIAQRVGGEIVTAPTLAIMNGYAANEQPLPGDLIKVVLPG